MAARTDDGTCLSHPSMWLLALAHRRWAPVLGTPASSRRVFEACIVSTTSATTELPRLVDIETLAASLGVSVRHVRRLVQERRIPYIKWGHLLRFDPTDVRAWVNEATIAPLN
jgi:excisionase family DNA binding protein